MGIFDYPRTENHASFTVALQSNFVDGSGGGTLFRFVGPEGTISMSFSELTLSKVGITKSGARAVLRGYNSVSTFSEAQQKAFAERFQAALPASEPAPEAKTEKYVVPNGYDDRLDHMVNFFRCARQKSPVYEDAVFGLRTAGPALLANTSYREKRQIGWDPVEMKVTG
jgi:hypothetical protein